MDKFLYNSTKVYCLSNNQNITLLNGSAGDILHCCWSLCLLLPSLSRCGLQEHCFTTVLNSLEWRSSRWLAWWTDLSAQGHLGLSRSPTNIDHSRLVHSQQGATDLLQLTAHHLLRYLEYVSLFIFHPPKAVQRDMRKQFKL